MTKVIYIGKPFVSEFTTMTEAFAVGDRVVDMDGKKWIIKTMTKAENVNLESEDGTTGRFTTKNILAARYVKMTATPSTTQYDVDTKTLEAYEEYTNRVHALAFKTFDVVGVLNATSAKINNTYVVVEKGALKRWWQGHSAYRFVGIRLLGENVADNWTLGIDKKGRLVRQSDGIPSLVEVIENDPNRELKEQLNKFIANNKHAGRTYVALALLDSINDSKNE